MRDWTALEKSLITILAVVALSMFFFPLLVIHAPLVGEQDVSGYDIFSKMRQFSGQVDKSAPEPDTPRTLPSPDKQRVAEPEPPLSLRMAWLIPVS
ncbi:MAG: hypothetical protein WB586_29835, partial [Chthoniobacterales bacterium]